MLGSAANSSIHIGRRVALALLLTLAVSSAPLFAGMGHAERHESRREIDQLEDAWRNAILKANTAAMNTLLADDYMAITPNGTLQTKEQALASLRTGKVHFISLDISDRKVRFYGTTALVTSLAEVRGSSADGDFSGRYRYTRVYVRDARSAWKIVSFEASRIHEPDENK
jgi:ketosteroid isomerase-like protein